MPRHITNDGGNQGGTTSDTATKIDVTDNESTDENNLITFVANAGSITGSHALEMDGDLHYNPSSGRMTATAFVGNLVSESVVSTAAAADQTPLVAKAASGQSANIFEVQRNDGAALVSVSSTGTITAVVDINGGTIDNCDITVGSGKTLDVTNGTVTGLSSSSSTTYVKEHSLRLSTYYTNWQRPNTTYGFSYFLQGTNTGSSTKPTTWLDSYHPIFVLPVDMTLNSVHLTGSSTAIQDFELVLFKGVHPNVGSAGDWALTQIVPTDTSTAMQLDFASSNIIKTTSVTGLSISLTAGQALIPLWRRSSPDSTTSIYLKSSFSYVFTIS